MKTIILHNINNKDNQDSKSRQVEKDKEAEEQEEKDKREKVCWWCVHPPTVVASKSVVNSKGNKANHSVENNKEEFHPRLYSMHELCGEKAKKTTGSFCGFECCYAFMNRWGYESTEIAYLFQTFRKVQTKLETLDPMDDERGIKKVTDGRRNGDNLPFLVRAPDPFVLKYPFGGTLSIEEFRQNTTPFSNLPIPLSTFSHQTHVDIMLKSYHERKKYLDLISRKN